MIPSKGIVSLLSYLSKNDSLIFLNALILLYLVCSCCWIAFGWYESTYHYPLFTFIFLGFLQNAIIVPLAVSI